MRRFLSVGLLCLLCLLPAAGRADDLKGVVKKLDLETGILVVKPFTQDKTEELSLANKDVLVSNALGQPARLEDLHVGSRVTLKITGEFVTAVKLDGPAVWGILQQVDVAMQTLHLQDPVRKHTVRLTEVARILVNGEPGKLDALKMGQPVQVTFAPDGKTVLLVTYGRGVWSRDPHQKVNRVRAILMDTDPRAHVLSALVHPYTQPMYLGKLDTAPDIAVHLKFMERAFSDGTLGELRGPLPCTLLVDDQTNRVEGIEADLPTYLRHKIVALDPTGKSFQVEDVKKLQEMPLDPNVKVLLPRGLPGKATDLKPGQIITFATVPERTRVLVIQILK